MRPLVSVYADGSSTGKVGPGGWGYTLVLPDGREITGQGGEDGVTNNQMELMAAIRGLQDFQALGLDADVELVSDSQYTLGLATGQYSPTKNLNLARLLRELVLATGARTRWVRGHSGDHYQEICDDLAKASKEAVARGHGTDKTSELG